MLAGHERHEISAKKDIPYGSHGMQLLDVHLADGGGDDLTSVLFFHGGGFVGGHKNVAGDILYGNVATYFAKHGMIGVNATYRLAPDHPWPAGADDAGAAPSWAWDNISEFGGNPDRIVVMGQSAGATHVATHAFRSDIHGAGGPGCAGIILMSGIYHLGDGPMAPNYVAYHGKRAPDYAGKVVQGKIDGAKCPVFISIAEFAPPQFQWSGIGLMNELASGHGNTPRLKMLLAHNHIFQGMHIDTDDESLGAEAVDFIRTCVER